MHKTSEWLQSFTKGELRRSDLKTREFRPCMKIAITGGKGGVGKTSIALKVAGELARTGHRTLLIDCDSNLSNTSIKLGLSVDNKFEKLLSAEITFEECLIQRGNFHLLPACNGSFELFEGRLNMEEIIIDIINSHQHEYDYVVLDCPAGLSRDQLAICAFCDHRFVVVTPDRSSITDSYSLIKLLQQRFGTTSNHLLVNMYQSEKQFLKVATTLTETIQKFLGIDTHILGGIRKLEVSAEGFDTFFLSEEKNDWNKNFIKILYEFTEKTGGPLYAQETVGLRAVAFEHDVH
jgi:flagellar biosynthesis protein FlhG